jgi:hypothetical protein
MGRQLLDSLSVLGVAGLFALVTFLFYEAGFRVGRWWQNREPGEQEGPTNALVGAILALQAFLLAITMGMAADRFDTRRGLVVAEANAIGRTYLQADYLPESSADQMKELLREYLPLRIATDERTVIQANAKRSMELHREMWAIAAVVAQSGYLPDLVSSFGDSLTEVVSMSQTRVSALEARVPETVLILLLAGSALSLGMVGYSAGLTGRRGLLSAVVLIVALGAVMTLVIDLDRPQEGFLQVSQQPLLDVQSWIGSPSP